MRILCIAAVVTIAGGPALAEQPARLRLPKTDLIVKPVPLRAGGNPCAAFGPGFARVAGSEACVKVGGSVGIDGGVRR